MRGGGAVGVLAPFVGGTYYGSLVAGVGAAAETYGRRLLAIRARCARSWPASPSHADRRRAGRRRRGGHLPNRSSFAVSLEAAVGRAVAVLFLDLDGFKQVNDTLGHHAGDLLLVSVADRLRQCLRSRDVAARFGDDEFVVLLDDVGPGPALDELINRIRTAICAPYRLGEEVARVGVSIGWADCAVGTTVEQLLQDADSAMYRAKLAGAKAG